jgi:hypothetical protein
MGVRFSSVVTTTLVNAVFTGAAETIILTSPPISPSLANGAMLIVWFANVQTGPTGTQLRTLLRRGGALTSTLINPNTLGVPVTANVQQQASGCYVDFPGDVAGVQYSLTLQQVGATGNGAFSDAAMIVFSL